MERRRALKLFLIVTLFVAVFESEVEGARSLKADYDDDTVDRPNLVGTLDLPDLGFNIPGLGGFPCPSGGAGGGLPGGGAGGGLPGGGAGVGWDKICALFPIIPGCNSGGSGGKSPP